MKGMEAVGERFAVSSGSPDATRVAAEVLSVGGNVVDAAVAGSAALCVTLPHAVSIGGDLFALVARPGAAPIAVNGTGAAPIAASIAHYRGLGLDAVPVRGPLSVQTPGLVAAWGALCDGFGSLPLARLLDPAIVLARDGFAVGGRLAALAAAAAAEYSAEHGWAVTYLHRGRPLEAGQWLRQGRLADTLAAIARDGPRAFYEGAIADDIARTVRAAGGLLTAGDMSRVRAEIGPALRGAYLGRAVWTQPPISQGVVLLRALRLMEAAPSSTLASLWPRVVEAFATAFGERLSLLGDAAGRRERAEAMIEGLAQPAAGRSFAARTGTDTTTICVVDRDGNAATLILSVFADFGAGIVSDETGVLLNNRLSAFFMDPIHPNALGPGRRTMHTLHSVVVEDDDGVAMAGGSPGGDNQPQVNAQILARILAYRESPAAAVAASRFALFPGTAPADLSGCPASVVRCEPGMPTAEYDALASGPRRMVVSETADIGSAKWVLRSRAARTLTAVADTRRDGAVWAV